MNTHTLRKLSAALLLLALLISASCQKAVCGGPPPDDGGGVLPAATADLSVGVYLDATLSMKGFIVPGTATYYQQLLPLLESAAGRAWPSGRVTFYKFGSQIGELGGRQQLEAARQEFYGTAELNARTYIENVIDAADPQALTLIVTDLFQDNADINLVTSKLREKYVSRGLAVGVLGVRSEYAGKVYDVGVNNYTFDYKSAGADASTYRPFYVLMLGRHADIEQYHRMLEQGGLSRYPSRNFIIFSSHLGSPVATFRGAKINSAQNLVQVGNLTAADPRVKQFRLGNSDKPGSFAATLKFSPLANTLMPPSAELVPEVTAWRCAGAAQGQPAALGDAPDAAAAFSVKAASLSGEELKVEAEVAPRQLAAKAVYCFRVVLRPRELPLPEWVAAWDMNPRNIEAWRLRPGEFNGATTFNLQPFLNDLAGVVAQMHRPRVSEFYCYVSKG
ncbi:MAG TPA: hypothetical protein VF508_09015 [Pyrinomonadaceae bacterium]